MSTQLIAPLPQLIAEGYRVIGVGADVVGLAAYVKQRLELLKDEVASLPTNESKPAARFAYG